MLLLHPLNILTACLIVQVEAVSCDKRNRNAENIIKCSKLPRVEVSDIITKLSGAVNFLLSQKVTPVLFSFAKSIFVNNNVNIVRRAGNI